MTPDANTRDKHPLKWEIDYHGRPQRALQRDTGDRQLWMLAGMLALMGGALVGLALEWWRP